MDNSNRNDLYNFDSIKSKAKSSAKSWFFNILMNMLMINWLFYYLSNAKRGISRWVKVFRSWMKSSFSFSPLINIVNLYYFKLTTLFLSPSGTLTIWPKLGTTLILMLLYITHTVPIFSVSILEWHWLKFDIYIKIKFIDAA